MRGKMTRINEEDPPTRNGSLLRTDKSKGIYATLGSRWTFFEICCRRDKNLGIVRLTPLPNSTRPFSLDRTNNGSANFGEVDLVMISRAN